MDDLFEISHKYMQMGNDMIMVHRNGIIQWANHRFLKIMGYNLLEVVGRHCIEFVADEFRKISLERITRGFSGKDTVNKPIEVRYRRADGSEFWAMTVSAPIDIDIGPAVLVVGRDITERKNDEELIKNVIIFLLPKQLGRLFDLMIQGKSREEIIRIMDLDNDTISRYVRRIRKRIQLADNDSLFNRFLCFFRDK
ncbi:MAG: hypothetical protein CVV44_20160 [Spirochaetae bacterium HGW-Spirochaetae-1]|jgi:PAS domain S-box-containing protein|nr:MAG: hypothetical protein CVV44_20160 [Spirochaetae bacterium HGW-Spirochaetae-1]